MNERHLQEKCLIPFFQDGLKYQEVKANTVTQSLIIEEDLEEFISNTELNKKPYESLLKKYHHDKKRLLQELMCHSFQRKRRRKRRLSRQNTQCVAELLIYKQTTKHPLSAAKI